jgi:hypothetical protein
MKQNKEVIRYWFPEWRVICSKHGNNYSVINGGWDFYYRESDGLRFFFKGDKKPVSEITSQPIPVTKSQFYDLVGDFGYWD